MIRVVLIGRVQNIGGKEFFGVIDVPRKDRDVSFEARKKGSSNDQEMFLLALKIVVDNRVIGNKMRISYEIKPGFANALA